MPNVNLAGKIPPVLYRSRGVIASSPSLSLRRRSAVTGTYPAFSERRRKCLPSAWGRTRLTRPTVPKTVPPCAGEPTTADAAPRSRGRRLVSPAEEPERSKQHDQCGQHALSCRPVDLRINQWGWRSGFGDPQPPPRVSSEQRARGTTTMQRRPAPRVHP